LTLCEMLDYVKVFCRRSDYLNKQNDEAIMHLSGTLDYVISINTFICLFKSNQSPGLSFAESSAKHLPYLSSDSFAKTNPAPYMSLPPLVRWQHNLSSPDPLTLVLNKRQLALPGKARSLLSLNSLLSCSPRSKRMYIHRYIHTPFTLVQSSSPTLRRIEHVGFLEAILTQLLPVVSIIVGYTCKFHWSQFWHRRVTQWEPE
jgi:hypothetical protein